MSFIGSGLSYLIKNPVVGLYIVAQYQMGFVQAGVPRNGLVAEYLFNANTLDSSGNGNDGIPFGTKNVEDRCGNPNSAMDFDGLAYIQGPADKFPTATRSVSLWINAALHYYTPEIDRGISIFGYGGGGSTDHLTSMVITLNNACLAPNTYSIQSHNKENLATWTDSSMFGSKSEWIHLAFTIDKHEGTEIYINGVWKDSSPSFMKDTYVNGKNFVIGSCINPNGVGPYQDPCVSNWIGMLDDLRIYDFKLSAAQVADLANEQCSAASTGIDWRLIAFPVIAGAVCLATGIVGSKIHYNRKKMLEEKLGGISAIKGMITVAPPVAPPVALSITGSSDPDVQVMDQNRYAYRRIENVVEPEVKSTDKNSQREQEQKLLETTARSETVSAATSTLAIEEVEEKKEAAIPASSHPNTMFGQLRHAISFPTQVQEPTRIFGIQ